MSLLLAEWPDVDRAAFAEAVRRGDILEPGGPAAHWRPATVDATVEGYGYWLAWLRDLGQLSIAVNDPASRLTAGRLSDYLRVMNERGYRQATIAMRLRMLRRMLAVMSPEADLSILHRLQQRVDTRHANLRVDRLRGAGELVQLGSDLMREAEASTDNLKTRARQYRNGLLIALLAMRPLRRNNMASLDLGTHIVRDADGWRIRIPAGEMKNGRPLDDPFPDALAAPLECYLRSYRLALAPIDVAIDPWSGPLWISTRTGKAMSGHTINLTVCGITAARFGKPINLHMFRDIAATTLALEDPGHVRIAAAVNGHADYQTTERWYNLATMTSASLAYQGVIAELREELSR